MLALLLSATLALAQSIIPTCQKTCQDKSLTIAGCTAPTDACACNSPYESAMTNCLVQPTSEGGCTYDQILSWQTAYYTQCQVSAPLVPPCLTICDLQSIELANCSSESDTACICASTYTNAATSCISKGCPDRLDKWTQDHATLCGSSTGTSSGSTNTGSSTSSRSATATSVSSNGTQTGTGTASSVSSTGTGSTGAAASSPKFAIYDGQNVKWVIAGTWMLVLAAVGF
ncbi:SubName: Full=Uncharacterized protein {ECO:0000313/EMBL:CCA69188.1} [Serendipita indica DSM 11827]|nr:SubName: Full=Uncharacterized protein {ECO:0000313/EMBL:CCA69188.1} [Serendipita indica DSM 11827]